MTRDGFESLRSLGWSAADETERPGPGEPSTPLNSHVVGPRNSDDPAMMFSDSDSLLAAGERVLIFDHDPRIPLELME